MDRLYCRHCLSFKHEKRVLIRMVAQRNRIWTLDWMDYMDSVL